MIMGLIAMLVIGLIVGGAIFYYRGKRIGYEIGRKELPGELTDLIADEQRELAKEVIEKWKNATKRKG